MDIPIWPRFDPKLQLEDRYRLDGEAHQRQLTLPSYEFITKETNDPMQILPLAMALEPTPPVGLVGAFRVIYQHLHEKHYLDRIVHALYLQADGQIGMSKKSSDHHPRLAFVRALYPRPAQLHDAVIQARGNYQDPPLLSFLFTEPKLLFRMCAITHLFEAALALPVGAWDGDHPRQLSSSEMSYVMEKLQGIIQSLFQQESSRLCLIRELSNTRLWSEQGNKAGDEEENMLSEIMTTTFPCLDLIIQEYRNLLEVGRHDAALNSEVNALYKFVMESLEKRTFVCSQTWIPEGCAIFESLRKTLGGTRYHGPAQRLIRNVVSMIHQLWESGGTTNTSLAIEKILVNSVQKPLRGPDAINTSSRIGIEVSDGWDLTDDFERLVRAVSSQTAPVPLPSIVWKRESLEICLDSMVLHFPRLMPSNIHLNSTMEFDKITNKLRRQWRLKILGLEIEAKTTPYHFMAKTPLNRRFVDVGELSFSIPANSLDIEIDFSLSTSDKGQSTATLPYQSQDHRGNERFLSNLSTNESPRGAGSSELKHSRVNGSDLEISRTKNGHFDPIEEDLQIGWKIAYDSAWTSANPTTNRITWDAPHIQLSREGGKRSPQSLDQGTPRVIQRRNRKRLLSKDTNAREAKHSIGSPVKKLVNVKDCSVNLRKLNVVVDKTKHPILCNFIHLILVRQIRMALEQTLKQAIIDVISAVNTSAEEISGLTREEIENRHRNVALSISERPKFTAAQEPQHRQLGPTKDANIYSAMPLSSNI
ncbi:hypothetical protein BGZ46_000937 [Entomortierella lignicola]|nr:hypothetical protein BGZ46_000937 [Entomortierella lignicola]